MTTLRDGTVVNESVDAVHFTAPSDCNYIFGHPRTIESITIHHWGALGQNIRDVVNYLSSDNPRQSSAHAVIQAGEAWSIVSPENAAWHAGNAHGNATSIGLECHPEATDGDYATVAAYIAFLRSLYGDLPLIPHRNWVQTACPGVWDLDRLDKLARNAAITAPPAAPSGPANTPQVPQLYPDSDIHWVVERGDTLSGIAAYYGIPKDVQRIADYNHIAVNSILNIGQKIFIPGPLVWNIEAPDTIVSVAQYYGLDPDYLARLNGLPDRNSEIYIGNTLTIKE